MSDLAALGPDEHDDGKPGVPPGNSGTSSSTSSPSPTSPPTTTRNSPPTVNENEETDETGFMERAPSTDGMVSVLQGLRLRQTPVWHPGFDVPSLFFTVCDDTTALTALGAGFRFPSRVRRPSSHSSHEFPLPAHGMLQRQVFMDDDDDDPNSNATTVEVPHPPVHLPQN